MEDFQKSWPFFLAIIGQTAAIVWYVSALDGNVKQNTRDVLRHEVRLESLEKIIHEQALTLARIDENIKSIREVVEQVKK
tara:strand:+ start:95 stop:334 length:240 start_codon:yes stop_codon:yes gene_type:complete